MNLEVDRICQMLPERRRARAGPLFLGSAYHDPIRVQSKQPGHAFASFLGDGFCASMIPMVRAPGVASVSPGATPWRRTIQKVEAT